MTAVLHVTAEEAPALFAPDFLWCHRLQGTENLHACGRPHAEFLWTFVKEFSGPVLENTLLVDGLANHEANFLPA